MPREGMSRITSNHSSKPVHTLNLTSRKNSSLISRCCGEWHSCTQSPQFQYRFNILAILFKTLQNINNHLCVGFITFPAPSIFKYNIRSGLSPSSPQHTYCIQCVDQCVMCALCSVWCVDKGLSLLLLEWT